MGKTETDRESVSGAVKVAVVAKAQVGVPEAHRNGEARGPVMTRVVDQPLLTADAPDRDKRAGGTPRVRDPEARSPGTREPGGPDAQEEVPPVRLRMGAVRRGTVRVGTGSLVVRKIRDDARSVGPPKGSPAPHPPARVATTVTGESAVPAGGETWIGRHAVEEQARRHDGTGRKSHGFRDVRHPRRPHSRRRSPAGSSQRTSWMP